MLERIKTACEGVKSFAKNAVTKNKLAVGGTAAAVGTAIMSVAASADGTGTAVTAPSIANTINSSSAIDFSQIFQQMADLVPVVLPVIIAGLALRKGISFLMSMVRGI